MKAGLQTLLVGVQALLEEIITGEDHDDGQVLVHKGEHTVLELTAHDGLAVQVADFLDLEGTFQRCAVLAATTEQEQALLVSEGALAESLDLLVLREDGLDLVTDLRETLHNLLSSLLLGSAVLAQ